ncbi:MAG TPA: exopolysaccharide biosynthesis protein [Gemmatimonadota bacterium]|nr:exopolysaccharide biosynthesis protein [Gemmatimonadota bacterium]
MNELEDHLLRIAGAAEGDDRVSLEEILAAMENVSFGALLLVAGLVTLVPIIGDIPGVPTTMGILVVLGSAQLLLGRESMWLPRWLRERSVRASTVTKGIERAQPVARTVDRVLKRRLDLFVQGAATYVIAVVTLLLGAVMPVMEFIPFSANLAGVVLTAFGLALMARDGLLSLLGLALIAAAVVLVVVRFLG